MPTPFSLLQRQCALLLVLLSLALTAGCGKSGPPEPLAPEQAQEDLARVFSKSKLAIRDQATKVAEALQAKRYQDASVLLMELSREPSLNGKEREAVTRAILGVNQSLREAQSKGDATSAEFLRQVQRTK